MSGSNNGGCGTNNNSSSRSSSVGRGCIQSPRTGQQGKMDSTQEISYGELTTNLNDVTVIDVRNRNEMAVCGQIPGSHCIPVTEIKYACGLDCDTFKTRYGFDKPNPEDPLVVCCRTGVRSKTACDILQAKGFKRHRIYRGSFSEWEEKGGEVIKPGQPHEFNFEDSEEEEDEEQPCNGSRNS